MWVYGRVSGISVISTLVKSVNVIDCYSGQDSLFSHKSVMYMTISLLSEGFDATNDTNIPSYASGLLPQGYSLSLQSLEAHQ